jgi:hypothetical protein
MCIRPRSIGTGLQQYRDFVSNWDTAKDVTDLTRYVACSLSLKRRGHKPFLSHQDEVALAAWVVHQAQFGLAITKDQLAAEACKMALRTRPHHALTRQWVAEGR